MQTREAPDFWGLHKKIKVSILKSAVINILF